MLKSIVTLFFSFCVLDTAWIRLVAVKWYQSSVPSLLLVKDGVVSAQVGPAILFYLVVIFALYWLVVMPQHKVSAAVVNGAVAGLMSYSTYALTCLSIYKGWTWSLAIGDIVWGTVLCAVSCGLAVYVKSA